MNKLKVLIIDDETRAREILVTYLNQKIRNVEIVGEAANVKDAVIGINTHQPDLILLDIEMPGGNGFDVLSYFPQANFQVVFVTAYNEFAVQAFKVSAVDYLTKPIIIKELIQAIEKAREKVDQNQYNQLLENLNLNLNQENKVAQKLALPDQFGYRFIKISNISYFEADGSYSSLKLKGKEDKVIISKKLIDIENSLEHPQMLRVHRSFVINLDFVKQYLKQDGGTIIMNCGREIPVSRSRKNEFLERIQKL